MQNNHGNLFLTLSYYKSFILKVKLWVKYKLS